MDRRKVLGVVAAVAIGSAGIGWIAGQRIKSPADIAAETAPPEASLITVPVEQVSLSSNIVTRGSVRFSDSTEVSVGASVAGFTTITEVPGEAGASLAEGDVIVEIAGRPVIALEGLLPVFRSLNPGTEGPDVQQLEEALVRLGLNPGTVDEVYTVDTEAAVRGLYERAGYSAEPISLDDEARIQNAADGVRRAEEALRTARSSSAGADTPASQRRRLDLAVEEATTNLNLASVRAEQTKNDVWMQAATAKTIAETAASDLATATERAAGAAAGTDPDTGNPVTPERVQELNVAVAEARDALDTANAAAKAAADLEVQTFIEQDGFVASAKGELDIAVAQRTEGLANPVDNDAQSRIRDAQEALADAKKVLVETNAQVGTRVPDAEIVFLPRLPQTIERVNVEVGDNLSGPVMRITGSEVVIESSIPAADRPVLSVGDEAVVDDAATGISFRAEISELADNPGGGDLGNDRYALKLQAIGELPEEALDRNLRVTIPFGSTGGDVLAVPLAALSASADGSSRVEIERSPGETEFVDVTPGLRAGGLVQITPLGGASLSEGDRAVVGRSASEVTGESESESDSGTDDESELESDEESEGAQGRS